MTEQMQKRADTEPLLTIAIPTYNRASYLRKLLSVLFDQLVSEPRVELLISDNASPDETPVLVEEYQRRGLRIRSIRNETNIGADANFLQCFEQARGKYLWIFSDDDIIVPGGIAKILPLLARENYALAYVSPYEFRGDFSAKIKADRLGRFAEILPGGLPLARRVGTMLTFISAVIVNKNCVPAATVRALPDLIGTSLIQMGWICPLLASNFKTLMIWEKLVAGQGGNCAGWGACQVFGINLKRIADSTLRDRKDIAASLCNRTLQRWFPGTIMDIRRGAAQGLKAENMREMLEPVYKTNWRYWIYVYPAISLPLLMAGIFVFIIQLSNRIGRVFLAILNFLFSSGTFIRES